LRILKVWHPSRHQWREIPAAAAQHRTTLFLRSFRRLTGAARKIILWP